MRIRYYEDKDTLLITFKEEPVYESEYIEGSGIVVDYSQKGEVVGLEIFGWSKKRGKNEESVLKNETLQTDPPGSPMHGKKI